MTTCDQTVDKNDPFSGYAEIDAANWSTLSSMAKSAKAYKHILSNPPDTTSAMLVGQAIHCLVLEPEHYTSRFVRCELTRNPTHKKYQAFLAEHKGKAILSVKESQKVEGCASAILRDPYAMSFLNRSRKEFAITWTDKETGIACKARIDLKSDRLVDIKTTGDVRERKFRKIAFELNYPGKLAFYRDGLEANGYDMSLTPVLIVAEQDAPHDVAVYMVPDETIDFGRRQYRECLRKLAECRRSNDWPGYSTGEPLYLHVPPWIEARDMSKAMATIDGMPLEI